MAAALNPAAFILGALSFASSAQNFVTACCFFTWDHLSGEMLRSRFQSGTRPAAFASGSA